jgi:hypothetical protein
MKIYKNKDMFRLCLFMFHTFYLVAMCVHLNTMNNILLETSQPVSIFCTNKIHSSWFPDAEVDDV